MRWLVLACVSLLAAVYLIAVTRPAYGVFHDDGVYLVTAKALAEGKGYRLLSTPGEPPQTKYPILFPGLLSLVWRADPSFPDNLLALKLVPLVAAGAWLCVSWLLLRELGTQRWLATAIVLLTAASQWTVFLATSLMSETVFAFLLTCGLWLFVRTVHGDRRRFDPMAAGLCLGLAALTRTAGLVPAAVCVGVLAWRREWRAMRDCALAVGVCVVPWVAWVWQQNSAATVVDVYSSGTAYAQWHVFALPEWGDRWHVVRQNAAKIGLSPETLWIWPTLPAEWGVILSAAAWGLLCVGLLHARRSVLTWVVVAYVAMMLVWIWPPVRFAVPLLPIFLWLATRAAGPRVSVALVASLGLAAAVSVTARAKTAIEVDGFWPGDEQENWRSLAALTQWLQTHTAPDARVAGNLDPMLYLATGRQAVRPFLTNANRLIYSEGTWPIGTPDQILARLAAARVEFIVLTPMPGFLEANPYRHLLSSLPVQRVFSAGPGYDVFRLVPAGHAIARAHVSRPLEVANDSAAASTPGW